MAGVNAGSINLYLGAETAAFQAGMKRVTTDLNTLGGTYDQFSTRGARSVLTMANTMTSFTTISKMSGASIAANLNLLSFEFGHMADQLQNAAGSGKAALESLGKMAMTTSLVVGAAFAGWQAGRAISDITGLTDAVRNAKKPNEEFAASLVAVQQAQDTLALSTDATVNMYGILPQALALTGMGFAEYKASVLRVAASLGVLVPEEIRNAAANRDGALAVIEFSDKIHAADKAAVEYLGPLKSISEELYKSAVAHDTLTKSFTAASIEAGAETIVMNHRNQVLKDAFGIITNHLATEKEWNALLNGEAVSHLEAAAAAVVHAEAEAKYIDALLKSNNLMKDPDPAASIAARTEEMRLLGGAGADAGKLLKSDLAKGFVAAEEAALNSGKKMSDATIQLANAIKDNDVYAVQMWMNKWGEVPKSVDDAVAEATPHITEFQQKLVTDMTQPFGAGLKAFREFCAEIGSTKVQVNLDVNVGDLAGAIRRAIADATRGAVPDTSGHNR